jgi:CIC family chloride channel protein
VSTGVVAGLLGATLMALLFQVQYAAFGYHGGEFAPAVQATPLAAFGILGLDGIGYPQLFGNGKDMAHGVFLSAGSLGLLLALAALKPLVTALCLASGLFTPVLSTGAVLSGGLRLLWSHLWPGTQLGAYAMVGCAMQAPITGLALVLELTYSGFELMTPMILATVVATVLVRYLDGYSIYSARLPAHSEPGLAG